MSQISPVYNFLNHFVKFHFNIILSSMPKSPNWTPSFRFSFHNSTCVYIPSHSFYIPIFPSCFDYDNNILWRVWIMKFLITKILLFAPSWARHPNIMPWNSLFSSVEAAFSSLPTEDNCFIRTKIQRSFPLRRGYCTQLEVKVKLSLYLTN
jgi:hypothetical protein